MYVVARRIWERGIGVLAEGPDAKLASGQRPLIALGKTAHHLRVQQPLVRADEVGNVDLGMSACDSAALPTKKRLQAGSDSRAQMERRLVLPARKRHESLVAFFASVVSSESSIEF